jgi:hypothetical protein
MSFNLTFNQAIAILGFVLPILVPAGQALLQHLLERLPSARRSQLESIVGVVVHGVEQSASGVPGETKKQDAVNAVVAMAKAAGLSRFANPTTVSMLIEAAVYELNAGYRGTGAEMVAPMGFAPSAPAPTL